VKGQKPIADRSAAAGTAALRPKKAEKLPAIESAERMVAQKPGCCAVLRRKLVTAGVMTDAGYKAASRYWESGPCNNPLVGGSRVCSSCEDSWSVEGNQIVDPNHLVNLKALGGKS
jgi:hypothetical protein